MHKALAFQKQIPYLAVNFWKTEQNERTSSYRKTIVRIIRHCAHHRHFGCWERHHYAHYHGIFYQHYAIANL